ncbi:copper chaperone PCu(A)C [Geodermatophilus sp. SYSU D00525]
MEQRTGARTPLGTATGAAVLVLLATACSTGQDAETAQETPDTPGVDGSVGQVALDDVYLDADATIAAGDSVALRGALTNDADTDDRLVSVSTPSAGSVALLDEQGGSSPDGIDLPADGSVDATQGQVRMQLDDVTADITTADTVPVTFAFRNAGQVQLDVPVGTAGQ